VFSVKCKVEFFGELRTESAVDSNVSDEPLLNKLFLKPNGLLEFVFPTEASLLIRLKLNGFFKFNSPAEGLLFLIAQEK